MSNAPYLYRSASSIETSARAVIVLPEIFGLNDFVRSVADRAARELQCIGVGLDHFYAANGQVNKIGYDEHDKGVSLMSQVTGAKFLDLLSTAIDTLQAEFPGVVEIVVMGFCFGGKLAYLSGVDQRVQTIVSFYGGASLAADFYQDNSAVEALAAARRQDSTLRVLGLFGQRDELIPESDRTEIRQILSQANISTQMQLYPAGHAFFNHDRPDRYVESAAEQAWMDIRSFLG